MPLSVPFLFALNMVSRLKDSEEASHAERVSSLAWTTGEMTGVPWPFRGIVVANCRSPLLLHNFEVQRVGDNSQQADLHSMWSPCAPKSLEIEACGTLARTNPCKVKHFEQYLEPFRAHSPGKCSTLSSCMHKLPRKQLHFDPAACTKTLEITAS